MWSDISCQDYDTSPPCFFMAKLLNLMVFYFRFGAVLFGTYLAEDLFREPKRRYTSFHLLQAEHLMDIKAQALYQEMQGMASQTQLGLGQSNDIQGNPSSQNFADLLSNAIGTVNEMQLESRNAQKAFEMGDKSLSLADVMVAKEKSGIAFEATIQVRNKVLDAYKQIMNMPV